MPVTQATSQTIKNLTNTSKYTNNIITFHVVIYSIPCKDCEKQYIGETQCNLQKESMNTNNILN